MNLSLRRSAQIVFAALLTAAPILAQEGEKHAEGESSMTMILLWVNFAVLAGGIAWLIRKFGAPFLAARGAKIQNDIADAAERKKTADARAAEVDRRLGDLDASLASLRADSQREIEAQKKRIAELTASEIAKIRTGIEQEAASAGKAARAELRRYTAQLAIQLAETKIQSRITPDADDQLLKAFLAGLPSHAAKSQSN